MIDPFADLPIIQCLPGPTDAELQAQRDAKHEREVTEWFAERRWAEMFDDHIPAWKVIG